MNFVAALLLSVGSAHAYENVCTHRELTGRAVDFVSQSSPNRYDELLAYRSQLTDASYSEDTPKLAVLNHFYDPSTRRALNIPGMLGAITGLAMQPESAMERADRYWNEAIKEYKAGSRQNAYERMGRALHLLQDLHQPAHVQNDPHIPPESISLKIEGFDGTDRSMLEESVENRFNSLPPVCNDLKLGEFFPVGSGFINVGPRQYDWNATRLDNKDFLEQGAVTTYAASSFPGSLPAREVGVHGEFSVLGAPKDVQYIAGDVFSKTRKCFTVGHWIFIDSISDSELCYSPSFTFDGTVLYGFNNDWWRVSGSDGSEGAFYIEKFDQVYITPSLSLNNHFANSLLPAAINLSASYLKFFADTIDRKEPIVTVNRPGGSQLDAAGDNYVSDGDTIEIATLDAEYLNFESNETFKPSGIYRLEVVQLPNHSVSYTQTLDGDLGEVAQVVSGLLDGIYEVRAYDGLGNLGRKTLIVDAHGGPQPEDSPDPLCPKINGVITCTKPTGRHGEACVTASKSGHKPVNARINGIAQTPYPRSSEKLCIDWACTQPGTYDISIEFSDDRGNWAQTHKIHCEDNPPTVIACSDTNVCRTTPVSPTSILTGTVTVVVTSQESTIAAGAPDACIAIEQLAGGICTFRGFGGNNSVVWQKDFSPPSHTTAHTLYQPEPGRRYQNLFYDVSVSLNGGDLFGVRYDKHGTGHVQIDMPALGQPQANCVPSNTACVASPGSGGGGSGGGSGGNGGGYPPPPPIDSFPPTPAMKGAAANSGMAVIGDAISLGAADRILSRPLTVTHITGVPPFQPTQATKICWWTGTGLVCETPANVACVGTKCTLSSTVIHASTWVFAAPLPAFYPDMTAPSLADINISEDGTAWNAPGGLIRTTDAFVRMTARDPPSGIELISGLTVSSVPFPFASTDPSLILHLHFDEGSGSQLFDSSRFASTGTINFSPVWVPGRFGPALEFSGISGERAAAPVAERFNSGPFSIEAWVYPTDKVGNRRIANKGTGYMQTLEFLTANGRLQASIGDGSAGYTVTSAETLPLNQWSLVAMSFDGAKLRIFVNGAQKGQIPAAYSSNDSTLVIGALWKGRIDEFRLLTRGLGRSEAALDYRRGFAALASADGGLSWKMASHHDSGAAAESQPGPAVLSASGFTLARSTYSNIIEFAVTDASGNYASTGLSVPVAPPDTTPLALVDAEISANNGSTWYPLGAIPRPGLADFRVKVKDPALGEALRSGIATSTATLPFTSDASTLLLLHLDEGAGAPLDSSANVFTVLAQNGPTWTSGRFAGAMQFNGDWQFLGISGNPPGLDVPDWTASAWVYPTETFTGGIVSKINDARYGFTFKLTSGRPELNVHNAVNGFAGGTTITAPDVLPLNQWTAVTATSDRNAIRIFVNGELKASAPGYMDPNSAPLLIGAGGSGPPFWRGRLDEIRFMSRAQSPEEVLLDYRRGYVALFSSNGGASWAMPTASYGSALQGELDTVMTVSTLTLTDSLTSNRLKIIAADAAGNTASATYVLPAALDAGVPASPVVVSTQLAQHAAVSIAWERGLGEVPVSYSLYRATEPVATLAGLLPVATSTGMSALDAPPSALGDVIYYALTATNLQGGVSSPSSSVQTLLDRTPPVTVVDVQGGIPGDPGVIYALPTSTLTLSATDQGTGVSGVAEVTLTVDGTPVAVATTPFQLPEGSHQLNYYATDATGNSETPRETTASVDATAPISTLTVTGDGIRDSLDRMIIVAGQEVVLSAQDGAVGVGSIFYRLDSGTWTVSGGPMTIPEGQHVLQFYAVDRLGNAEEARSQAFVVALPPLGGVSVVSPISNSFTVSWSSMSGAAGYVVVASSAADFSTVAFSTAVETLHVVVDGLQSLTTYYIRVAYFSDSNDSLPVSLTAFTSAPPPVPPLSITSIAPSAATTGETVATALTGTGFDASAALSLERNMISQGTWTATGSFMRGRYHATLTKLSDGRLLLAGGRDPAVNGSYLTNADLYDPATASWTAGPPMIRGHVLHASVLMADGRVLVTGGAPWPYYNAVEIFDPVRSTWTTAAPMAYARSLHGLALLPDGRVLAASGWDGGNFMSSAEIYDPVANTWSPAPSLSTARRNAQMTTLSDGRIMIAGGEGVATAEIYDPVTNAWTPAGTMSHARQRHRIALLPNGNVLATGGFGPMGVSSTTDVYDPEKNAWTAAAPMGGPRGEHEMVLVNGKPLVIGGTNASADLASTEIYDAATNSWQTGPTLMGTRLIPNAATLADGRVLVAAGYRSNVGLSTAETLNMTSTQIPATGVTVADAEHLAGNYDLTGAATGYWDVVVRESGGRIGRRGAGFQVLPSHPLASIAVTPMAVTILPGATVQFMAAGTFADGSTRTLTGEVAWSTDVSSVANVDASGLALGTSSGRVTVTAALDGISGQGVLHVAFVATSTGAVGGSAEVTLVSTAPFSVVLASTESGAGAVALGSATSQGLLLVSPVYEVTRQDPGATATLRWSFDPALVDTATLAIWRFDGTAWSSSTVLNQVVSVTGGAGTVTGEVVLTSLFALFSRDTSAPVTTLLVDGLPSGATSLTLVETSVLGFAAHDAGVGVRETRYALDGGVETVFVSTFGLAPGAHALSYRSVDRGGNLEAAKFAAITVLSSDTEPPLVRLDFPGAAPSGIEQALGGVVDVRGAVSDASAVSWTLELAPGAAAAGGFTTIASGAGALSGLITAWNTAPLAGYQTLRLSATDASGNAASATATVFVGAPVMTFAVGRKNSDAIVSTLKGPTGIAVRSDGSIWVASTENDQILLISPAGVLLGAAGRAPGRSAEDTGEDKTGKKDKDRDDEEKGHGDRIFKTPQGLALDAAGSLYVADRDLNRVVKLSPDGQNLLLQFGRAGAGPGELRHPFDVAVDANGDVYAADAGNRRVSVFDASGAFLRQFGAGVFLSTSEIRGLALTSEGLWVSDKELEAIHLFSRSGTLLKTISGADSAVGELSRMRGLASDRLGALYVVEPNRDRVQKFDPRGKGLLAFGTKAGLSLADTKAKRWLTQPIDAAVAPDGSIWVTDKGRDRIVRYALPSANGGLAALSTGGGEFTSESAEAARRVVDHKDGASVSRDDGSGVRVPKGALDADLEITVEKGDESVDKEPKEAKRRELKVTAVSDEVQYGPEGTTFNAPVTLTIPYDANLIASRGLREDDLKVYYWNPTLQEWQAMPSTVDKRSKTVNALTNHFSAYQVGALGGIGTAAVDDFGLRDGYVFPNPSRNGSAVTFRMQPGSADSIEVRVYDLSGRKVHSSSDFRFLGAVDDGNGKGAQNTYDHVWNVSGIGSGVYTFVMTAKKAGVADVRKTGKVGVIK